MFWFILLEFVMLQDGGKMDRCVIWGIGQDYEHIINQIKCEELKGSIQIVAVVARKDEIFGNKKDGYLLITKEKLQEVEFDILIIASTLYYREIFLEAQKLGISANRIICGKAFELSLFDYNRYISLVRNPVTILSDDCWGGGSLSCIVFGTHVPAD